MRVINLKFYKNSSKIDQGKKKKNVHFSDQLLPICNINYYHYNIFIILSKCTIFLLLYLDMLNYQEVKNMHLFTKTYLELFHYVNNTA